MSMKPGYYWVHYTPPVGTAYDAKDTVAELDDAGCWWLPGCDYPYHEDEIAVIKEIEKP